MLLTVKSIRIKRMNVEIFCERGVRKGVGTFVRARGVRRVKGAFARAQGRGAMFLGRLLGGRGVCKGVGAWGRGALFLGRSLGARNACMIFSQQT